MRSSRAGADISWARERHNQVARIRHGHGLARVLVLCSLVGLVGTVPATAAQAKGGPPKGGANAAQLSLISETVQDNPLLPGVSCLTEDDYDQRVFSGALNGSYSTSYQLCDLNTDGFTAGGIGLQSEVVATGQIADLVVTAPDGTVHQGVLMAQAKSGWTTTSTYEVCSVPLYFTSTGTGTDPLMGGTWTITLSGQLSSVSWQTNALMTDVNFQEGYCPVSEQNLSP